MVFVDTNVFLRHLCADHAQQSPRATAFLARIERGELAAQTSDTVIFETVFTLQRLYRQPKAAIRDALLLLLELPGLTVPGKRRLREALDLYVRYNLPFADAYHAALVRQRKLTAVISFDQDFDRIPDIVRQEPE